MQSKHCAGLCGGKALAASSTVQQVAAFVFSVLAADCNVSQSAQAIVFALIVWAEALIKISHGFPPELVNEPHWREVYDN
jgi:hypothetical protein